MPMWQKRLLDNKPLWPFFLVWCLAIAIRVIGISTPPQYYDMATFQAWGNHMLQVGPVHFYDHTWSDYLPLPLYFFAPIAALSQWLGVNFGIVFKSVMSLLELGLIYGILRVWKLQGKLLLLILLALSPIIIGDTAFWGQIDTIPALLALFSLVSLSPILFGLAVAIKPIVILVAPVIWIVSCKKKPWWQFPLISGLTFLATGLPMSGLHTIRLLWERTMEQAGTYPFTTINAWNVWSLIPNLSSWPSDNQIVLGLSSHTAGLILFCSLSLIVLNNWRKTHFSAHYGFRVAATLLIIFYTFTTRMHERHLLFGLPFLAVATLFEPWILLPLTLLTCSFTFNLFAAFYWVEHAQVWPFSSSFVSLISWLNVLTALTLTFIWHWPTFLHKTKLILAKNRVLFLILVLASCLRLINLQYPATYIFDEVYHAFTAREYLHNHVAAWEWWTTPPSGVAYEWTHPPVAKYGMVLGMLLFGENSFGWRIGSAVAGIICILGIYLLTYALSRNTLTANLAAFLTSIEGLHLSQSRIGMNDMYMLVFLIWSLYAAVKSRWKWSAILYGLALASKWSAMYGIIPLALLYFYQNNAKIWHLKSGILCIVHALRCALIAICTYLLTFTPFILAGHSWAQLLELHRQMWYYHTHLVATHAYQSVPLQWIFAARPVWYYVNYGENLGNIYAQGNPLILWLGLAALILSLKKILTFRYSIFFVLYAIFTLPWIASPRIMFFYHYLPSATFLCVILAIWLAEIPKKYMLTILAFCALAFVLLSPVYYGFPISHLYWDALFKLFPSWR